MADDSASTPPASAVGSSAAVAGAPATKPAVKTVELGPIICPGHSRPVPHVAFTDVLGPGTDDEHYFISSSCLDGKPMVRDGADGNWVGTFEGHKGAVWCCRLSSAANGCRRALTASADFSVKYWDAETGDCLHTIECKHVMKSATFDKAETHCISGGHTKEIQIHDLANYDADPDLIPVGSIIARLETPDANTIVSCGSHKTLQIWDRRTLKLAKQIDFDDKLTDLCGSVDGKFLTVCAGKTVSVLDATNFDKLYTMASSVKVGCAAYDSTKGRVAVGSPNELWVRTYDIASGKELGVHKGHHGPARCIAVAPLGRSFASGSEDGTIRIWDWPTEKKS